SAMPLGSFLFGFVDHLGVHHWIHARPAGQTGSMTIVRFKGPTFPTILKENSVRPDRNNPRKGQAHWRQGIAGFFDLAESILLWIQSLRLLGLAMVPPKPFELVLLPGQAENRLFFPPLQASSLVESW